MYRVLLADDSKPIRRVVELTLERDDVDLRLAADGAEALRLVDDGFAPDVALLDVHMPQVGGIELCRMLRERFPEVQVLLLVGTFEPFEAEEGEAAGAQGHLLKPFAADDLGRRVKELLGIGAVTAPEIEETRGGEEAGDVELPADDERGAERQAGAGEVDGGTTEGAPSEPAEASPAPSILTGVSPAAADREGTGRGVTGPGAAEPAEEPPADGSSVGEPQASPGLTAEELDTLARKVAGYLVDKLNVEEMFARVAGEEVRKRIDQLERELADEDRES